MDIGTVSLSYVPTLHPHALSKRKIAHPTDRDSRQACPRNGGSKDGGLANTDARTTEGANEYDEQQQHDEQRGPHGVLPRHFAFTPPGSTVSGRQRIVT